jgi:hypothetical protein
MLNTFMQDQTNALFRTMINAMLTMAQEQLKALWLLSNYDDEEKWENLDKTFWIEAWEDNIVGFVEIYENGMHLDPTEKNFTYLADLKGPEIVGSKEALMSA